jgi:diguanylate cyclase (GGDEF)-like protein/PAS domain S-box-containing protein
VTFTTLRTLRSEPKEIYLLDENNAARAFDPLRSEVLSTGVFERPGTILVVDDDPAFSLALRQLLERENHDVFTADDGRSGLQTAQQEKPDLYIIDVGLPDTDGFDLCKRIKADPELRYSPVVMLTGLIGHEAHIRAMQSGANDFLTKPFDWSVFRARVSALLKYRRAVSALRNARVELEQRVQERTAELQQSNERLKKEIAERERIEHALRESEERYALAARGANDGLWDWNLTSNQIYYSTRWRSMVGFEDKDISASPDEWFRRVHAEDIGALKVAVEAHLAANTDYLEHEYRMLYNDGTWRWMLCRGMAVRDEAGNVLRMAGSQSDITVRKMAELQLLHNAFHDELTGLPNRALFTDRLGHAMARTSADGEANLAVLHLDIDRFKIVNDSLGHKVGNQLLIEIGRRLKRSLRPSDTVARLGADEFAILVEDVKSLNDANEIAFAIHEGMKAPFKLREREVFVTTSVGIVLSKKRYARPEDMLRDSETAMHRAKSQGKARHETFHSGMHAQVVTLMHLEHDLRRAVENKEFIVYYQPIIALAGCRISGFEALVRWKHPERGLVSPGEFLPLAEETDLITPMSLWVLEEAARQLRDWQQRFPRPTPLSVSVNLSGRTFAQPGLTAEVARVLAQSQVKPGTLKLEITEGAIMCNAEASEQTLAQLKTMGVPLLVDDFGKGYSSLSYLHQLPIDVLKIDHSFVMNMELGDKNLEIVKTIVALANNLHLQVVAEGVETARQFEIIQQLGCEYAQGYLFAKPAEVATIEKLLQTDPQF